MNFDDEAGSEIRTYVSAHARYARIDDADVAVASKRTASYSRFSSDGQKESSIERQDAVILAYSKRGSFQEVPDERRFVDRGRSGSRMDGREGLAQMMKAAREGAFDVLLLEDLDRLSRDMADLAVIAKELKRLRIEIHTATYGLVKDVHVAFYGLLGMEQRLTLIRRTSLGRWLAAMRGSNPVGIPYGYRNGRAPGKLYIVESQANIIRRIFKLFNDGLNAQDIAFLLNEEGVKSPKGGMWASATIIGSSKLGSGILRNPKYVGVLVFGRTETLGPTELKKRNLRIRSPDKWVYFEKEEWQIVDRRLWVAVQKRLTSDRDEAMAEVSKNGPMPRNKSSSKSTDIFKGAYRCVCGSKMASIFLNGSRSRHIECQDAKHHGNCKISRKVSLGFVEVEILRLIRDRILCEEAREIFALEYAKELERLSEHDAEQLKILTDRIKELDFMVDRSIVKAIYEGAEENAARLRQKWRQEKDRAMSRVRELGTPLTKEEIDIRVANVAELGKCIDELIVQIPFQASDEQGLRLVARLRRLIPHVTVDLSQPTIRLHVRASLARLVDGGSRKRSNEAAHDLIEIMCAEPRPFQLAAAEKYAILEFQANSNIFGSTDEDWLLIQGELSIFSYRDLSARMVFDAGMFYLRTGRGLENLPPPFGDFTNIANAVRKMVRFGLFARAVAILEAEGSKTTENVDLAPFADLMSKGGFDKRLAAVERNALITSQAKLNMFMTLDDDWILIKPLFNDFSYLKISNRLIFDAGIFYLRTKRRLDSLPPPFGDYSNMAYAVRKMVRTGFFTQAVAILEGAGSKTVEGLDLSPFATLLRGRRIDRALAGC